MVGICRGGNYYQESLFSKEGGRTERTGCFASYGCNFKRYGGARFAGKRDISDSTTATVGASSNIFNNFNKVYWRIGVTKSSLGIIVSS